MKLTNTEKVIIKSLKEYWHWIARDVNGSLYIFQFKPMKLKTYWCHLDNDVVDPVYLNTLFKDKVFSFIKWEDEEPVSIDELKKL